VLIDGLYLKDLSAARRQLLTLLERDHGILINCKRVRRVRQAVVPYLETALGLVPADGKPLPPRLERVR
jgi:hypothetical protein